MRMTWVNWKHSDKRDYKKAQKERAKLYSRVDEVLYEMCDKWPDHKNLGIVHAKVRIIGRVYGTGLERKSKKDKIKGIYETVSNILNQNGPLVDQEIRELKAYGQLSKESYQKILFAHGKLVRLLRENTKSKLNFRSFASKYLHFHVPIVPIFDSQASKIINYPDWYPWKPFKKHALIPMRKEYDPVYFKFFNQFIIYYCDVEKLKLHPTTRSADWFLIWSADNYYDSRKN